MRLIYATEKLGSKNPSIFLAGPTPRDAFTPSWRPAALKELSRLNFSGTVMLPEDREGKFHGNYDHQVDWETAALNAADVLLFWIPRELVSMPAFTTNVEFGLWVGSGKVVAGAPENAPKTRYLQKTAERFGVGWFSTLADVAEASVQKAVDLSLQN